MSTIGDQKAIISRRTYGPDGAVFTVSSTTLVHSSPASIHTILTDFSSYHLWNTFVVKVTGVNERYPAENGAMNFRVARLFPFFTAFAPETITVLHAEGRVSVWRSRSPVPLLLRAERINTVVEVGDGTSKVTCSETFYGPLAWFVKFLLRGRLQRAFEAQNEDLKKWAEKDSRG